MHGTYGPRHFTVARPQPNPIMVCKGLAWNGPHQRPSTHPPIHPSGYAYVCT